MREAQGHQVATLRQLSGQSGALGARNILPRRVPGVCQACGRRARAVFSQRKYQSAGVHPLDRDPFAEPKIR